MPINSAGYLRLTPLQLKRAHSKACKIIESNGLKFASIAFSGYSGALVAPAVAAQLDKRLLVVRKNPTDSHGCRTEGEERGSFILLDDFISSGETIRRIFSILDEDRPGLKCVGIVLYSQHEGPIYAEAVIVERKTGRYHVEGIPVYYRVKR